MEIPSWSSHELNFIPSTGFALLEGELSKSISAKLAYESIGSPHLMQEFCRAICREHSVIDSFNGRSADINDATINRVFVSAADTIGRPIFEKLARGTANEGWTKVGPGTPVTNIRIVYPRWYHRAWQQLCRWFGVN